MSDVLSSAIKRRDLEALESLLTAGEDLEARDARGLTPLLVAASWDNELATSMLLNAGADIEGSTEDGETPLHRAAIHGSTSLVRLLCQHGAAVDAKTRPGLSALDLATNYGRTGVMQVLHDTGADRGRNGVAALRHAIHTGMDEAVKLLIHWGVFEAASYEERVQIMKQAARHGHLRVLRALLDGGFPNTKEIVSVALRYRRADVAHLLRSRAETV